MFLSSVMSDGASQSVLELRILPVRILIETPDTEILIGNGHIILKRALLRTDGPEVCGSILSTNQIVIFML